MPRGKATIDTDGEFLYVRFKFAWEIVDAIKDGIPSTHQSWHKTEKAWAVDPLYFDDICAILEEYDYAIRDYTGTDPEAKMRKWAHIARRDEREAKRKDQARRAKQSEKLRQHTQRMREDKAKQTKTKTGERPEHEPGDWIEYARRRARWETMFFQSNPVRTKDDFDYWWRLFEQHGRDGANSLFRKWAETHPPKGSKAKARQYGYQQYNPRTDGDFADWFRQRQTKLPAVDHYAVLGIVQGTPFKEAKAAYRRLALEHHPDRQGDEAMMKKVNVAKDAIWKERGWK